MLDRTAANAERARVARNAINRFLPAIAALRDLREQGRLESFDGGFVAPVREALLKAFDDAGRKEDNREIAYGVLKGCHSVLDAVIPGTLLIEGLALTCDMVASILNTESPQWIEAQAEDIDDILAKLTQAAADATAQAA